MRGLNVDATGDEGPLVPPVNAKSRELKFGLPSLTWAKSLPRAVGV